MPEKAFDKLWDECYGHATVDRVLHVKRIFRVSYGTVLHRLVDSGRADAKLIWPRFRAALQQRYGIRFSRKEEPFPISEPAEGREPERLSSSDFVEDRLNSLVRRAFEAGDITASRAGEILGLSLDDMRKLVASWECVR
jgi:hypothetical protein